MSVEEEQQVYDHLSQVNKHMMLANGLFDFDDIPNGECYCGHSESEHLIDLDGTADCCLYAKDSVCICEKFVDKRSEVTTLKVKVPSLRQPEDPLVNSYVKQLAQI
jgi:hypothetical protein